MKKMERQLYCRLDVENLKKLRGDVFTHVVPNTNENRMIYLATQGHIVDIFVGADQQNNTAAYSFPARLLQVFYLVGGMSILSISFVEYETEGQRELRDTALLVLLFKKDPRRGTS